MTASDLLTTLGERGLTLTADGDALIVRPRELLTDELRDAIKAHKPEILAELAAANDARVDAPEPDSGTERRRAKALALLAEHPNWHRAVIAEAGRPPVLGVAIRGMAYGEIELPADYDPAQLMTVIERHGGTVH